MVSRDYILEVFEELSLDNILIKCGRKQIQSKLNKYSPSEKKELLQGRLNEGEWKEYNYYSDKIEYYTEKLKNYEDYPDDVTLLMDYEFFDDVYQLRDTLNERISRYTDTLFNYDRRIIDDYKINKNPVPEFDKSQFIEDDNGDRYGVSISMGPIETEMIDLQDETHTYTDFEKESLDLWWGSFHKQINRKWYNELYPSEKMNTELLNKISQASRGISQAIHNSAGLSKPTVMFRGGIFDISLNPGDHMTFKGFVSLTFNEQSSQRFALGDKFTYKCYVPTGVKGVCGNSGQLENGYGIEHEYLLDKGTGCTILNVDYENRVVEVLIDEP